MYTNEVMKHFQYPQKLGDVENANGIGKVGNPVCGDVMQISIRVEDDVIKDAKVKTFGCVAAISTSDVVCEKATGLKVEDALKLTKDDIIKELGELPQEKIHCSLLGIDALKKAIEDYRSKN